MRTPPLIARHLIQFTDVATVMYGQGMKMIAITGQQSRPLVHVQIKICQTANSGFVVGSLAGDTRQRNGTRCRRPLRHASCIHLDPCPPPNFMHGDGTAATAHAFGNSGKSAREERCSTSPAARHHQDHPQYARNSYVHIITRLRMKL